MGVRYLNPYLKRMCPQSIEVQPLSALSGKTITVDVSIYLYGYLAEGKLMENMYIMMSIFRYYGIVPWFVFDGHYSSDKKWLIDQRRDRRQWAQDQYNQLLASHHPVDSPQMKELKKQGVYLTRDHIQPVKQLMAAFGYTWMEAEGEADEVCALLVIQQQAWACLSEDMDMFVYGCPRVLRYFHLIQHTVTIYHLRSILRELHMNQDQFREVCCLAGTDYNQHHIHINLVMAAFYQYQQDQKEKQKHKKQRQQQQHDHPISFLSWFQMMYPAHRPMATTISIGPFQLTPESAIPYVVKSNAIHAIDDNDESMFRSIAQCMLPYNFYFVLPIII